jgi:peroxiredoxin Q/BCP
MTRLPLLAGLGLLLSCGSAPAADLAVGDTAPDFSLPGSDGKTHGLAEHRGQRAVVLAWFPKAFTGG